MDSWIDRWMDRCSLFNSVLTDGRHHVYNLEVKINAVILISHLFQLIEYSHFRNKHLNDFVAEVVYVLS